MWVNPGHRGEAAGVSVDDTASLLGEQMLCVTCLPAWLPFSTFSQPFGPSVISFSLAAGHWVCPVQSLLASGGLLNYSDFPPLWSLQLLFLTQWVLLSCTKCQNALPSIPDTTSLCLHSGFSCSTLSVHWNLSFLHCSFLTGAEWLAVQTAA